VDHEVDDAQQGDTAVVDFNSTIGDCVLLGKVVSDKVDVAVEEVTHGLVVGSFDIVLEV
jgi:hypothetical protein